MVDRPDAVLIGIPTVVASGYGLSVLSQTTGFAHDITQGFQAMGYLAAMALICWAVWIRTDRRR